MTIPAEKVFPADVASASDYLINQVTAMLRSGQLGQVVDHWKSLLVTAPSEAGIAEHLNKVAARLNSCGVALYNRSRSEEALDCFTLALRARPNCAPILNNAGSCLKELGRLEESTAAYRQALELQPDYATAHSNLLLNMHYEPGVTLPILATAHKEWDDRHGAGMHVPPSHASNDPQPDRVLRVGLVSPDFCQHPVGIFLVRYLENIDPAQIAFTCYATKRRDSSLTDRMRKAVIGWHDVEDMDDDALARKIRSDGIDILIDLSGHTADNRLGVFARKPAPIQIGWLGYPGDSGLSAMDYVIGDRFVLPEAMQPYMRATILQLPHGFVCFDPPTDAPPVSALPAKKPGAITFGCFNNPAKCSDDVIALWSDILMRLPQARLLLKYKAFGAPSTRQRFEQKFAARGIDTSRLEFQGESPLPEMFAAMSRVDCALDPFPFSGGLMTCLTLWMGVPVLTLPGEIFASRQGLSFLSSLGITDMIATSVQDYSDKAVALANDLERLADLRKRLRPAMETSPLCDGRQAAADFQNLLREIWRNWCKERN